MKGIEEEEEESDTPQNWDLASNHMDYTQPERERENKARDQKNQKRIHFFILAAIVVLH